MDTYQNFTKILIVEDERLIAWSLASSLHKLGYDIVVADSGEKAIEMLSSTPVGLVITDVELPQTDGFEVASVVKQRYPSVPVILMSAVQDSLRKKDISPDLIDSFIEKPFDLKEVVIKVNQLLHASSSRQLDLATEG